MDRKAYQWLIPAALALAAVPVYIRQSVASRRDYKDMMVRADTFQYLPYVTPLEMIDFDAYARAEGFNRHGSRKAYSDIVINRMHSSVFRTFPSRGFSRFSGMVTDPNTHEQIGVDIDISFVPGPGEQVWVGFLPDGNGNGSVGDKKRLPDFYRRLNEKVQREFARNYREYSNQARNRMVKQRV